MPDSTSLVTFQVMSPMGMEPKFDSLRERWDKRNGIKWLVTLIRSPAIVFCES